MSLNSDPAPENSIAGRRLRAAFARVSSLLSIFRASPAEQPISAGNRGHLGRQRALRLSTLLAPRNRLKLAGAGIVIIAVAAIGSLAFRSPAVLTRNNAIWLDRSWTFGDRDSNRLRELNTRLNENQIGTAYVYVSSLGMDNRWSGDAQGTGSFMDSRALVADFVRDINSQNDNLRVFGWVEVWTHLDSVDGYRLDDPNLHSNIADFSRLLITQLGFDGILLDVKPLFRDNNDLIRLIGRVRAAVGLEYPIAVAVTADLTPQDLREQKIESIAPGTMWSPSFKKRVMVSADEVVLLMYQSYRQDPRDYVNWVAYHIEAYIDQLETSTKVLVSIPNYGGASSAHNPAIETMDKALEGVGEGLRRLDEEQRPLLTGIAIFSDKPLSPKDWDTFREMWLTR